MSGETVDGLGYLILGILVMVIAVFWVLFPLIVYGQLKELLRMVASIGSNREGTLRHASTDAEIKAVANGVEKLHQDLRLAFFDATTCGDCGVGFEFPTRLSGKKTICPHCGTEINLPD